MLANMSADVTHRFQPFQPSSELIEKVDQPNQPKTVFPNRTRKNATNSTNQKRLITLEHDLIVYKRLLSWVWFLCCLQANPVSKPTILFTSVFNLLVSLSSFVGDHPFHRGRVNSKEGAKKENSVS